MFCIQETLLAIPMSNMAKGKQKAITTSSRSRSPDRPHTHTSLSPIREERKWEHSQSSMPGRDGTAGLLAQTSPQFTVSDINKIMGEIQGTACSIMPRTWIYALVHLITFFLHYGWLTNSTAKDTHKAPPTATSNSSSNQIEKTRHIYHR
jgi:hypothetical protein